MRTYEFQGKNVDKVIEDGLKELGRSKFDLDVEIKILDSGSLFKKAKVQIIIDDGIDEKKEEKVEEVKTEVETAKEEQVEETKEEPKSVTEEVVEEPEVVEAEEVKEETHEVKLHISDYEDGQDVHEKEEKKEKRVYENNKGSKEFLEGLLKVLEIEGKVNLEEQEEHTKIMIDTESAGALIGHRGDTLSAIQYLTNIVEQKTNRNAKRVIIDIAEYRERKDDNLKDLADRMARKVLKLRKAVKLKPMNAYDRRIVHTYLQTFDGVETHSEGVEPNRCLVIEPKRD